MNAHTKDTDRNDDPLRLLIDQRKQAEEGQDIEIYIQSAKHFFRPEHREEIDGTGDRHIIHVMTMFSFDFSNAFSQKDDYQQAKEPGDPPVEPVDRLIGHQIQWQDLIQACPDRPQHTAGNEAILIGHGKERRIVLCHGVLKITQIIEYRKCQHGSDKLPVSFFLNFIKLLCHFYLSLSTINSKMSH